MRAYPFVGSYWPDADFTLAPTIGNFSVVHDYLSFTAPASAEALRSSGLQVVQIVTPLSDDLLMYGRQSRDWPVVEDHARRWRAAQLPEPTGLLISDELFAHLRAGHFANWPALRGVTITPTIIDLFSAGVDRYALALKSLWPDSLIGSTDHCWNSDRRDRDYSPMPPSYDFCALDAYSDTGDPGGVVHRHAIRYRYRECWEAYHRPILAVPQAFEWPGYPQYSAPLSWSSIKSQLEVIDHCEGVGGICYFALDAGAGPLIGIKQRGEALAGVQGYAQDTRVAALGALR